MMQTIVMYTSGGCSYCLNAEKLLLSKGAKEITKIMIDEDPQVLIEMMNKTGKRTVPQIFIGNQYIGGFDDLRNSDFSGELDRLLFIKK